MSLTEHVSPCQNEAIPIYKLVSNNENKSFKKNVKILTKMFSLFFLIINGAPLSPSHGYAVPTVSTAQKLFSCKSGKFNKHFSLEVVVKDA